MESALLWFSALTSLLAMCLAAACAYACWKRASASTWPAKRVREMELELAELASSLDSTIATLRKLSARQGMRDLRAKRSDETPPTTKQEARDRYLRGRTHQEIAMLAVRGGEQ